jgi:DNA-binding transcriptional ArsR family regulator
MRTKRNSRLCRSVGEASDLLKSIANPNRLSIVCLLLEGERSVAEIESELGIRQPTLSQQLSELRDAGVVATRREAKHVYYRVADDRAGRIVMTLRDIFSGLEDWCDRLPASEAHRRRASAPADLMLYD